jgi:hypothetical protein
VRHLARYCCGRSNVRDRWVLVVRRREMLVRLVLRAPLRDGVIHQARTGEPWYFAICQLRRALLQPKVDVALFLRSLVPTLLWKDGGTHPTKISVQGFSANCAPRPEPRRLKAGGGPHLPHLAAAHLHRLGQELAEPLLQQVLVLVVGSTGLGLLLLSRLWLFAERETWRI